MVLSDAANTGGFFYLVPFVVFFPVIGLLINIFFGGRMGEKVIGAIACLASGLSFVIAVLLGIALLGQPEGVVVPYLNWITIGNLAAGLGLPRGYPLGDHDAGGRWGGHTDPYLCRRLHAR